VNAALAAMKIDTGAAQGDFRIDVSATLAPGPNIFYNPINGDYYQYVVAPNITWTDALNAAAALSFKGATGFLVTVPDKQQNDFLANNVDATNIWIGASDADVEGTWKWVTGPEAGVAFWQGLSAAQGGVTLPPLNFASWNGGEPNNFNKEDYAVTNWQGSRGKWNDLRNAPSFGIAGYVTEFNGPFTGVESTTKTASVTDGDGGLGGDGGAGGAGGAGATGGVSSSSGAPGGTGGSGGAGGNGGTNGGTGGTGGNGGTGGTAPTGQSGSLGGTGTAGVGPSGSSGGPGGTGGTAGTAGPLV
jgi:hypothetical protein